MPAALPAPILAVPWSPDWSSRAVRRSFRPPRHPWAFVPAFLLDLFQRLLLTTCVVFVVAYGGGYLYWKHCTRTYEVYLWQDPLGFGLFTVHYYPWEEKPKDRMIAVDWNYDRR
ncbi:MAG: hypothetical protein H3C27_14830 [Opitutaceae bacterium]|nr:hypothetical protein [Opitutaceae bacterium]